MATRNKPETIKTAPPSGAPREAHQQAGKSAQNQQVMIHVKPTAHNLAALETGAKRRGWEGAKAIAAAGVIRLFGQRQGSARIEQIAAFQAA